ncbi:lysyl-tRNA synthetase, class II [Microlunatus soli]|uniref:Lysine--tRNA ligase n=2 Tax=Microlunatus soli TaxID=630515 RepID=A0A1H1Y5P0_9ACTN|nr:lysyl-tRNA synthetase, class II [Microlunatus soli]
MVPARFPRLPYIASRFLYVAAAILILQVVFPAVPLFRLLARVYSTLLLPIDSVGLGSAVFLLIIASGVNRRKRVAWVVLMITLLGWTVILLGFALVFLLVVVSGEGARTDTITLIKLLVNVPPMIFVTGLLFLYRGEFRARRRRGNVRRAVLTLVLGLLVAFGIGALLVNLFPGSIAPRGRLPWLARQVFKIDADDLPPIHQGPPLWTSTVTGVFVAAALIAALVVLTRSQSRSAYLAAVDERTIRGLLRDVPTDSLGYFATRRDKSAVFASDGRSAITYRVQLGVCLASGDPLGPPQRWPAAIGAWLRLVQEYGWTPAVIGAGEDGAAAYAAAGMRVIRIGDEAILESDNFNLQQRELRPVAQAVRRLERRGYQVRIRRHGDIAADEMGRIADLADGWRETEEERGFSMALGRLGDPADSDCMLVEALFPADHPAAAGGPPGGVVAGLLSFVPWGPDGLSLDVMRRHPDSDNGITELMVSRLLLGGPDLGIRRVSLNFAVFRSAFEEGARIGAGPILRLWRRFLLVASRWWQIESLYRSNVKYNPTWVPRFLCYSTAGDIALVGLASGVAEGFIDLPDFLAPAPAVLTSDDEPRALPAAPAADESPARVPEQIRQRLAVRQQLIDDGIQPYPVGYAVDTSCGQLITGRSAGVAGRVLAVRDHGGIIFATVQDGTGRGQLMLTRDGVGDHQLDAFRRQIDLGDHLGAAGEVIVSDRGEVTLSVASWQLTAKSLRPLPDQHRGLAAETKVRQRYLDLITDPAAARRVTARSAAIRAVRDGLLARGFLEVETPILQTVHGGANARPFHTHINAYNLDLYLRIAPELYLKRLMVGGLDRVFEIGRNFRNEGADATHNPEFTMLEAYQAYGDYTSMRVIARQLIIDAARAALGRTVIAGVDQAGNRREVELDTDWPVITVNDAIGAALGESVTADTEQQTLIGYAEQLGIAIDPRWGRGAVLLELYEHLVEARTVEPTFYSDFPAEVSPLTRQHRVDPRLAERWDLVAFGAEIGTAYSELVDPHLQRARLTAQSLQAAGGDPEAMELDEDFLVALEHGMPPSGGLGMGLDRLVMLLTESNIRDVIAFPLVRPRAGR